MNIKHYIVKIIRMFLSVLPVDKKRITIVHSGNSGSNLNPLIKELEGKYKLKIIKNTQQKKYLQFGIMLEAN